MPLNRPLMPIRRHDSAPAFLTLLLFFCLLLGQATHAISAQPDKKELEKYTKAKARGDEKSAAEAAFEIGKKARGKKDYKTAETYYQNAIRSGLVAENYRLVAQAYSDLGGIANVQKQWKQALDYYQKAADFYFTKLNDKGAYGEEKLRAGLVFKGMRNYTKAIAFFNQAKNLGAESGNARLTQLATEQLSLVYRELGDNQRAAMYQELYAKLLKPAEKVTVLEKEATALANLGDSLNLTRQELEMQRRKMEILEEEKRRRSKEIMELVSANEAKTDSLIKANQILEATLEAQRIKDQRNLVALIAGIVFVVLVSISFVVVLKAYRAKNKANRILAQKNEEIEAQKAIIEEEKEKSEKLLLNILPKETAIELMEKGYATPRQYDMVTVLFTDFKGFTTIAEQLTPAEIIKDLDDCFFAFDEICEKYNLEKIKTIGDAYMCAAGLPVPNTTNPRDAVLAGLEMQAFMEQWKEKKIAQGKHYFELRLGIHTGSVVAGVVGKKKFAYDIWGDAVNTAARMESSGEVGRVNISGATYQYIKDDFFCSYRGKVPAKNKGEVDMYFVISKY
jgi:class 3 adenylate cyclase